MNIITTYCIAVCCLLFSLGVKAQSPFSKTILVEEENRALKSNVLFKDHNGFLWLGSSEGLFKVYGNKPVKLPVVDYEKLNITAIGEDADGTIWAGCKNGLIAFVKDRQLVLFKPQEGVPKVIITAILTDSLHRVWFATGGEGLYYYDKVHLGYIDSKKGLSDDYVNCLYSNDGKLILAGTDRGISFIECVGGKEILSSLNSKQGLPDNIVRCISKSQAANHVLIGTQSKGFFRLNIEEKKMEILSNAKWEYGQINALNELDNEVIMATEDMGLVSYNKQSAKIMPVQFGDIDQVKRIAAMEIDNEANIWVAAENSLISFTGQYLHYWYKSGDLKFQRVHALLADENGDLWLTPDVGLYHFGQTAAGLGTNTTRIAASILDQRADITCMYKDKYGCIWIGSMGGGLFRYSTKTGVCKKISVNPQANFANILSIAGKDDRVWISTLNGVTRFYLSELNADLSENIQYDTYTQKDGLGSDYVYSILIDSRDRVWFATDGAGLTVYQNGKFKNFLASKEFLSKVAYSVVEDKTGSIWVNTYNDGIFRYDGRKFRQYGLANGITDLAISSIAVDDLGRIVMVNKRGIDILDLASNACRHFGPETGMKEMQPNLNVITKDAAGNIWIGTDNGIVQLNLTAIPVIAAPVAVLENVLLFNQPVPENIGSSFNYNQNNLSFIFSAANYSSPEKIRFQYWLKGYSDKWETTNDRNVVFPKLSSGKYSLNIRASANDNFVSSPVAVYNFVIKKPFWLTWWFAVLSAIVLAGLVYWLVFLRINSIRKKDVMEKERIQLQYDALKNQVNPHFLFNSFNTLLNVVEENPSEAAALIKHLSQFYRKMTAYRRKDVILLEEELDLLRSYLYIQQKRFGAALVISIDVPEAVQLSTYIPPLVLQLLAENAVKHNSISYDNPLELRIYVDGDYLVVVNNMIQKFTKEESEGLGLQNIESRYKLFASKEVIYGKADNLFEVKLPIIKSK